MIHKNVSSNNSECKHDNIALMERWFEEVWNERRLETIDELMSPNCVQHFEHEKIIGRENWKEKFYDTMLKAIPNLAVETKDNIAAREIVVSRWEAKGVLSDELFGVSPSNELFEFNGITWTRIIDGKIVENWTNWNMSYLFRRLHSELQILRGILPICSFCKKIRDDKGYWEQVDIYLHKYSEADIIHSICPECMKIHYP